MNVKRDFLINKVYCDLLLPEGGSRPLLNDDPPRKGDTLCNVIHNFANRVVRDIPTDSGVRFDFPHPLPSSPDYKPDGEREVVMDGGRADDFRQKRYVYVTT
jgi:hypothetical protein